MLRFLLGGVPLVLHCWSLVTSLGDLDLCEWMFRCLNFGCGGVVVVAVCWLGCVLSGICVISMCFKLRYQALQSETVHSSVGLAYDLYSICVVDLWVSCITSVLKLAVISAATVLMTRY